jgi:futalosine hydrolase
MILVVCAVAQETAFLSPRPDVDVLVTGVGVVDAAARVARALAAKTYDFVINAGIAGALPGVARVGDGVVVAEEFLELNLETGAPIALPDGLRVADAVYCLEPVVGALQKRGFPAVRGVTVSRVTATDETAQRLLDLGAQVESMEGFAVLRAAELAGARAIEVRGISNIVGDRAKSEWSFASGIKGLERVLAATLEILDDVNRDDR